jgi:hypothetical protein
MKCQKHVGEFPYKEILQGQSPFTKKATVEENLPRLKYRPIY